MPSSSHDKDSRDEHRPRRDRHERRRSRDRERGRHRDRERDREREGSSATKKHKKHHKKRDRHRRHHRGSSSSSSSSPSHSRSRSRSSSPLRGSASSSSPSRRRSLSAARSVLSSLLALDPSSRPSLLSLLSAVDAGEVVLIDSVADEQARALLHRLLADCLCLQQAAAEAGGGQGWRLPREDRQQRLRLLPLLQEVLAEPAHSSEAERRAAAGDSEERREEGSAEVSKGGAAAQGESGDAEAVDDSRQRGSGDGNDSRQTVPTLSPALPAPPAAAPPPPDSQRRVIGPALPPHLVAEGRTESRENVDVSEEQPVPSRAEDEEPQDDEASYGPQLPSSLTATESAALAELREARQRAAQTRQLVASLRSSSSSSANAREEWMTVAPKALSGFLTGDATGLKSRTFSRQGASGRGGADESGGWTASAAEREWSRLEREAQRETDKAMQRVSRARAEAERERQSRGSSSSSAVSRRETAATSASPGAELLLSSAEPSLLQLHQRSLDASAASRAATAAAARGGPVFWDRDKDMGMRRQRSSAAVRAEVAAAAPQLSSRFHMSS